MRRLPLMFCLLVVVPFHGAGAAQQFTNVTGAAGVAMSGLGAAAAFGDFTGDGLPDLVISRNSPDYAVFVYTNDGDGTFTNVTASCGIGGYLGSLAWADYDGDGDLDLAGDNGNLVLYSNDGDGTFTNVTGAAGLVGVSTTKPVFLDYDNDGGLDILAAAHDCRLFHNDGGGVFSETTASAGLGAATADWSAVAFDYDDDGDSDLYLPNDPVSALWSNDGDGTFTDVTGAAGVGNAGSDPSGVAVGDYDGDGDLDLYVVNIGELPFEPDYHRLYANDGDGTFTDVTGAAGVGCYGDGRTAWFLDYDRDGLLDLFAASHVSDNAMYHNDGDGGFTDRATALNIDRPWDSFAATWADYDLDGDLDVYLAGHFDNRLLRNDDAPGNHLRLTLVGVTSNASALGARVRVTLDSGECWEELTGGGGLQGRREPPLTIGLGGDDSVDLRIWWPSGLVEDYTDLPAGANLTVTEGDGVEFDAPGIEFTGRVVDDGALLEWSSDDGNTGIVAWVLERDGGRLIELEASRSAFLDRDAAAGRAHRYLLTALTAEGPAHSYGPVELRIPEDSPADFRLSVPWPNPASDASSCRYALPEGVTGELALYDCAGRWLSSLSLTGRGEVELETAALPAGVYLLRLSAPARSITRRVLVR
ncbi:MAG: T9SS type A sorting domain-containing protein [Candidatus Coatesbacteria bacterium]|nr:T9SS type A sorting domain-containing protein [Candidatus Coatesbacteria bacterium]